MRTIFLKISAALAVTLAISCCGTARKTVEQAQTKHGEPDEKVLIAYVFNMKDLPDATYLTHINYAFGHVNETFNGVHIPDPDKLKAVSGLKKIYPHLKVLLSIGGWGSGRFSEMVTDPACRESFAKDCRRVVDEFKLDGIDIDWEYPGCGVAGISCAETDRDNYTLMMRDIRAAIGPDKLLTQATDASAKFVDFAAVDSYIDFTNAMTYDLGNAPYHNATLHRSGLTQSEQMSVEEGILAHLKAGIPPEKLVLGMPFYGRGRKGFPRNVDITKAHLIEGFVPQWDTTAMVPYLVDEKSGEFAFGYENERSLMMKARFALSKGLKGAMYWSYNGDNQYGDLRRTVYLTLNGIDPALGLKHR